MMADIISNVMYKYDSRKVDPGDVFVCLPGGELFVQQALDRGASSVVRHSRESFSELSRR